MRLYAGGRSPFRRSEAAIRPGHRTSEYPSWSSQIRRPGSTVFQKGVCKDELLSHDGCECDLCSLSVGTDLQLIDGTRGIISIFSARQPSENGAIPAPLFPDQLPEGAAYDALVRRVMGNEIIRGKLLSNDGELTLVVLALDPSAVESDRLRDVVGEIRTKMAEDIVGAGLKAELSGVPVMQLDIRNAVERDRLVYNTIGFSAGCLIAILFFRRVSFMIIAAGPPLIAILLALGALGWLDFRLNMFLNVMTPLIMVISYSDSLHSPRAAGCSRAKANSRP